MNGVNCNKTAAKRFFDKAMRTNGVFDRVMMKKSGATKAAIDEIYAKREIRIAVR